MYIRRLADVDAADIDLEALRATLNSIQDYSAVPDYFLTDRDRSVNDIASFDSVLADWQRRSKTGSIGREDQVRKLADFDPGKAKFTPQPDGLYFYENVGTSGRFRRRWMRQGQYRSGSSAIGGVLSGRVI